MTASNLLPGPENLTALGRNVLLASYNGSRGVPSVICATTPTALFVTASNRGADSAASCGPSNLLSVRSRPFFRVPGLRLVRYVALSWF